MTEKMYAYCIQYIYCRATFLLHASFRTGLPTFIAHYIKNNNQGVVIIIVLVFFKHIVPCIPATTCVVYDVRFYTVSVHKFIHPNNIQQNMIILHFWKKSIFMLFIQYIMWNVHVLTILFIFQSILISLSSLQEILKNVKKILESFYVISY